MTKSAFRTAASLAAFAVASTWSSAALAQDAVETPPQEDEARAPGEIIVTATRREEALSEVPIAVTALRASNSPIRASPTFARSTSSRRR